MYATVLCEVDNKVDDHDKANNKTDNKANNKANNSKEAGELQSNAETFPKKGSTLVSTVHRQHQDLV